MRTASGGRRRPISTHAPAGGATGAGQAAARAGQAISTHAPAGGATRHMNQGALPRAISTHAPAGGATHGDAGTGVLLRNFYSRPCGRGDSSCSTGATKSGKFLLTPLREGRPVRACWPTRGNHFYSRPCGRGDQCTPQSFLGAMIFLLTPLREGRQAVCSDFSPRILFLLTPLREGRHEKYEFE